MSYSRWSDSRWYTFWSAGECRGSMNSEVFEICAVASFTFQQLSNNMDYCLAEVSRLDPEATEEELEELRVYMKLFLKNIKEFYQKYEPKE